MRIAALYDVHEMPRALAAPPADAERAVVEIRASGWPGADDFVPENLLAAVPRDEAAAHFESLRR